MKRLLIALLFVTNMLVGYSHATDFVSGDLLYGWNGSAQFWQDWDDHITQLNVQYYPQSSIDVMMAAKANSVGGSLVGNLDDYAVYGNTGVLAGAFVTGRTYVIVTIGTTDFTAIGSSANTVGVKFTATGSGSGTGTADEALTLVEDTYANVVDPDLQTLTVTEIEALFAIPDAIEINIDGGGSAIATGVLPPVEVPFAFNITEARALCDQSGSIVVDVWVDSYANYPPTDADSITASAPITISGNNKSEDTTLTGWTKAITAENIIVLNVDSATTVENCTIVLKGTR